MEAEHVGGFGIHKAAVLKIILVAGYQPVIADPGGKDDVAEIIRVFGEQFVAHGIGTAGERDADGIIIELPGDHGDAIIMIKGHVIGSFVAHPKAYQDENGHADGKRYDIEDGIEFIADEVTPGDKEIVFEHWLLLWFDDNQKNAGLLMF